MKLDTAEAVLAALEEFCHADASGEREVWFSKGIESVATRLALGQRVLELVEWSATRKSCYAPEVRAMFESVLENAEAKEGGE